MTDQRMEAVPGLAPGKLAAGSGVDGFALAWRLALAGWLGCALLQIMLYVRPTPYGGPFLLEWTRYFSLALYYELLGIWLLSLPFFLFWLIFFRRPVDRRLARLIHAFHILLITANLVLSQIDHEVLRFLGVRLGFSFLATYVQTDTAFDSLFADVLLDDAGGPLLPILLLLLIPGTFLCYAIWRWRHAMPPRRTSLAALAAAILIAAVPLAAPGNAWLKATGKFRLRKIEPVILALAVDASLGFDDIRAPPDLAPLARAYQDRWLAISGDKGWHFPDRDYPYLRVPDAPSVPRPEDSWNIIYLQLETMRGQEMGFLRPDLRKSATPYLDRLANDPHTALWPRALSFGQPSINGLFAVHCSIMPHSRRYITAFTQTALYCLPEALRRHGYRIEMFNAGDTDWDNGSWWLTRWYDHLWRYPKAMEQDRPVFRAASQRIRALGASGRPFFATIVSVTNHTPFRSREAGLDIAGHGTARERIRNTTHYTDNVVGEFLESLRGEPWFARTIIVIAGDHGFNLGEHGGAAGEKTLYHESVWVPLILFGKHPRLPHGRAARLSSLLDVAPTLADLLGLREANSWQGHSLLSAPRDEILPFRSQDNMLFEDGDWSAVTDPRNGRARLYDSRRDWLQRNDLAALHPGAAEAMLEQARAATRLNDHLLSANRIWRGPPFGPGSKPR